MMWNLCDPIVDDWMGMRLADDGSFRFETDGITCFHNATLNYGRFINFFIAPGDSVYLTIDAGKLRGASDAISLPSKKVPRGMSGKEKYHSTKRAALCGSGIQ